MSSKSYKNPNVVKRNVKPQKLNMFYFFQYMLMNYKIQSRTSARNLIWIQIRIRKTGFVTDLVSSVFIIVKGCTRHLINYENAPTMHNQLTQIYHKNLHSKHDSSLLSCIINILCFVISRQKFRLI